MITCAQLGQVDARGELLGIDAVAGLMQSGT
jgi:hypothetical protein